jgi:phospholipid transport system substrate-binding protein
MISRRRMVQQLGLAFMVAAVPVARARADAQGAPAVDTIRTFYDQLSVTMKQGESLGFAGRRDRLQSAVRRAFDLPSMTRLAVGPRWQTLPPQQQSELINAFGDYSAATYASRFTHDSGLRFEVSANTTQTGFGTVVHTKLVRPDEDPVQLDYLMRSDGTGWRIEDIYLSGSISELATRRSEFSSVMDRGGAPALVEALRKKANGENG